MNNRIIRVFFDTDLRCSHAGLRKVMEKNGINAIRKGEHCVFINSRKDKIKLMTHNKVLCYFRQETGKLDLNAIREVIRAFNETGEFDWKRGLKQTLLKKLSTRK